jgi:hypothetical protein
LLAMPTTARPDPDNAGGGNHLYHRHPGQHRGGFVL